MYEGQEIPDNIQSICDNLDIKVRGRRGRNNNHRKKKNTDTRTSTVSNSDGILNDATPRVDVAKKIVSPSMVEETVAKEKLSPVVNTIVLNLYPPLPTQETTSAGNAPGGNGIDVVVSVESIRAINVNLLKEDVGTVPFWVKLHCVPIATFSEDGLSAIATKPVMIELRADVELRDNIVAAMPKIIEEGYYTCNIRVEYEWKLPRCACFKVFGHTQEECPKNIGTGEMRNLKKTSQTPKGFSVGQKMGFKPTKQVYQPVSKKPTGNTSVNKKKNVDPTKEVTTNSSRSSFWNVDTSSLSTNPVIEKIDKIKKMIIEGKVTLVDDEGKPMEKVSSSCDYDSEDEVASVKNDMAKFLAKKDGYGTQSLLEQWTKSYKNGDYGYDPYDDAPSNNHKQSKYRTHTLHPPPTTTHSPSLFKH
ncbi:hypothetical protein Tco_0369517 [Tanacetum coccineum]